VAPLNLISSFPMMPDFQGGKGAKSSIFISPERGMTQPVEHRLPLLERHHELVESLGDFLLGRAAFMIPN
jgi:hypothetical protein